MVDHDYNIHGNLVNLVYLYKYPVENNEPQNIATEEAHGLTNACKEGNENLEENKHDDDCVC